MKRKIPFFTKLLFILLIFNVFLLVFTIVSVNSTPDKYLNRILQDIENGNVMQYKHKEKLLEIKQIFDELRKAGFERINYHISYTGNSYSVDASFINVNSGFIRTLLLDFKFRKKYALCYELEDVKLEKLGDKNAN
ncbi:MAG: hypothetical protein L5655_02530 [Thermosediminibacteraceae bacterium]|nr:hypothetical protein [Thermosediminibacteraceae bacterium]